MVGERGGIASILIEVFISTIESEIFKFNKVQHSSELTEEFMRSFNALKSIHLIKSMDKQLGENVLLIYYLMLSVKEHQLSYFRKASPLLFYFISFYF